MHIPCRDCDEHDDQEIVGQGHLGSGPQEGIEDGRNLVACPGCIDVDVGEFNFGPQIGLTSGMTRPEHIGDDLFAPEFAVANGPVEKRRRSSPLTLNAGALGLAIGGQDGNKLTREGGTVWNSFLLRRYLTSDLTEATSG